MTDHTLWREFVKMEERAVAAEARLAEAERVIDAARELARYEVEGLSDGHLYWEEKYQVLYGAVAQYDASMTAGSADVCQHDWQATAYQRKRVVEKTCVRCGVTDSTVPASPA
ncbi:MAG: hypothetical protein EHM65_01210 [Acidobacteriales bacterium]|nr:MAG: hypothetical protein EHM65_01210 [Terriglobales bacterium]